MKFFTGEMVETVEVRRRRWRFFWLLVALYAVYLLGTPSDRILYGVTHSSTFSNRFSLAVLVIALMTLVLLVRPWPTKVRRISAVLVFIASTLAVLGLVPAVFIGALGGETDFVKTPIFVLSLFALLRLARAAIHIADRKTPISYIVPALSVVYLFVFGTWSLVSGAIVAWQAERIANGTPYCIAGTMEERGDYSAISHLRNLRGVDFHTYKTGYKTNSHWYFHGVLFTPEQPVRLWNWSITRMTFMPIETKRPLIIGPYYSCRPQKGFIANLPL